MSIVTIDELFAIVNDPEATGPCSWCHAPAAIVGVPAPMPGEQVYRWVNGAERRVWVFDGGSSGHGVWWNYTLDGITVTCSSRQAPTVGPNAGVAPRMCRTCHTG